MKWLMCMPLAAALFAACAPAQELDEARATFAASFVPPTAGPGATVELVVQVTPEPGWHLYGKPEQVGIPTRLTVTRPGGLTVSGPAVVPDGVPHQAGTLTSWWLEEPFELRQKMVVPADARPGAVEVGLEVQYMACTPMMCDPEATWEGTATLTVAAAVPDPEPARFHSERLEVEARFVPALAKAGDKVKLVLRVTPAPGWHVYGTKEQVGQPIGIAKVEGAGVRAEGKARVPDGEPHVMGGITSWWLGDTFEIEQDVRIAEDATPGVVPVEVTIAYAACDDKMCDPPDELTGKVDLIVEEGNAAPDPEPARFASERLEVEARFVPARAKAGGKVKLVLRVTPAPGWHVYGAKEQVGRPIAVAKVEGAGVRAEGNARVPDGEPHMMGPLTSWWLGEPFEIEQDVRVADDATPGVVPVEVTIGYTACDDKMCDPPAELTGTVDLILEEGRAEPEADDAAGGATEQGTQASAAGGARSSDGLIPQGLLAFLLAAVGWGLFALAMPCTYPMIPITISYFTKQAEARGGSVLPLALVYGLGIVLMFVVIGAVVGAPIQAFATHPVTNLAFAAVFLVFALSLFGLFNLQPPRWMMNLAGQASGKGGFGGVFLMGATLVITSFTCTAPFVGTLIGSAAALGLGWVVLGMAVFGLTMAVPFVLLSLLPGKARALPRGGEWMNTLKVFLGFVEVAAALKFVSNADLIWQWNSLPRELFLWLWAGIFGVAGLYLLGMIRMYGSDGVIGPGRLVGGLATILFAVYCVFGALGSPMDAVMSGIVPNYSAVAADGGNRFAALQPKHTIVRDDHDRAVQLAAAEGKLVLMNLTGFI